MKKAAFIISVVLITIISVKTYSRPAVENYDKTIRDFIESFMHTDYKTLDRIMETDAVLNIPRGEDVIVQHKSDIVEEMRSTGLSNQICTAKYEVLDKSKSLVIVRVDFDYNFTIQHQYLIIEKNEYKEWKITQIWKMFEDK